jgi:signal transduction histidine kinase
MVLADATQMYQILMNLATNAVHSMHPYGGCIDVTLTTVILNESSRTQSLNLLPGRYVRVIVSDTGHGMDQETMQKIFEPFFTTKGISEGTGLGLSVVQCLVREYHGAVTVESEPGKGTQFTLYLPVVE